jgi:hypothetical protein
MRGHWLLLDVRELVREQALSVASEGVATGPEDDMGSDRVRERVDGSGGFGCPLVAVNADRREIASEPCLEERARAVLDWLTGRGKDLADDLGCRRLCCVVLCGPARRAGLRTGRRSRFPSPEDPIGDPVRGPLEGAVGGPHQDA